jgi:hypothetical protein
VPDSPESSDRKDGRNKNIDFYAKILDEYNFIDPNNIIDFYIKSSQNFDLLKKLEDIEAYRNLSFKSIFEEKAEISIFLMTRNYCDSSLFDKNLKKARGMKKIILLVFLEEGISIERTYAYMSIIEILTSVTRISTGVTQHIFLLDGYFRGDRPIQYSFYEDLDFGSELGELMKCIYKKLNITVNVGVAFVLSVNFN